MRKAEVQVCGFHIYKKTWIPARSRKLECSKSRDKLIELDIINTYHTQAKYARPQGDNALHLCFTPYHPKHTNNNNNKANRQRHTQKTSSSHLHKPHKPRQHFLPLSNQGTTQHRPPPSTDLISQPGQTSAHTPVNPSISSTLCTGTCSRRQLRQPHTTASHPTSHQNTNRESS